MACGAWTHIMVFCKLWMISGAGTKSFSCSGRYGHYFNLTLSEACRAREEKMADGSIFSLFWHVHWIRFGGFSQLSSGVVSHTRSRLPSNPRHGRCTRSFGHCHVWWCHDGEDISSLLWGSPHKHLGLILLGLPYKEILGPLENLWIFNMPSCFHRCPGFAMMSTARWSNGWLEEIQGQHGTIPYWNRKIHRLRDRNPFQPVQS
jgi:hypothetical protein